MEYCQKCGEKIEANQKKVTYSNNECEICYCKSGRKLSCTIFTECSKLDCSNDEEMKKCCCMLKCQENLDEIQISTNQSKRVNFFTIFIIVFIITVMICIIFFCIKHSLSQRKKRKREEFMKAKRQSLSTISQRVASNKY